MERPLPSPLKKVEAKTSKRITIASSDRVEEPAHWVHRICLKLNDSINLSLSLQTIGQDVQRPGEKARVLLVPWVHKF